MSSQQTSTSNSTLFRNGLLFDGSGAPGRRADLLVKDGRVSEIADSIGTERADQVIDCTDKWVTPGLIDIHTHLDLEVELAPELPEVVRHGTTTVVMSNCSLGVAYGNQRTGDQDPVVDCFARVENVPKHVLRKVGDALDWNDSGDYLDHFKKLNLGPNVVPMIPHSMLRIEVMGLQDSLQRKPTEDELKKMDALVEKGLQEGYVGFTTDALPFHYLANQPNTRKQIPTQFAPFSEIKRLTHIVRRWDRVWQATPPKDSKVDTLRTFLLTSGLFYGKPLKTTATAAIDLHTDRRIANMGLYLSKILNSALLKGAFKFQCLSAPFKVWSDGVITPLAEEVPELRQLNELDLEDRDGRRKILDDPEYVKDFRKMWHKGKRGFTLANLKRILRIEDNVLNRRLDDMYVDQCPIAHWSGESLQMAYDRLRLWQAQGVGAKDQPEAEFFASFPKGEQDKPLDDADFFLHLMREWDTQFRWYTTTANRDPAMLKRLLFHPDTLPGFNDSGAHLTNMAFYDGNLRTLKLAQEEGMDVVAQSVHRLTGAPAEFLGLNVGLLKAGAQADVCVIDPSKLPAWQPEATVSYIWRDLFEHHMMVNRSEGLVSHTMIGGHLAWADGEFTQDYGKRPMGRCLRHRDHESEREYALSAAPEKLAAAA